MRGWLFLLGSAAFLTVGTLYRAPFFLAAGLLSLLVWLWMLAAAVWRKRKLRVVFAGSDAETTAGSGTVLPLRIERAGKMPPGDIRLRVREELRGKTGMRRFTLPEGGTAETVFRHAGLVRLTIVKAEATDPMGLFALRIPERDAAARETAVAVYPADGEDAQTADARGRQEEAFRARRDGGGREEIRAYAPGDPARRIHWKLSARFDDLLVRREREDETPLLEIRTEDCEPPFREDPDGFYADLAGKIRNALGEGILVRVTDRDGETFLIEAPEEEKSLYRRLFEKEED